MAPMIGSISRMGRRKGWRWIAVLNSLVYLVIPSDLDEPHEDVRRLWPYGPSAARIMCGHGHLRGQSMALGLSRAGRGGHGPEPADGAGRHRSRAPEVGCLAARVRPGGPGTPGGAAGWVGPFRSGRAGGGPRAVRGSSKAAVYPAS